jgi:hypothetical protein
LTQEVNGTACNGSGVRISSVDHQAFAARLDQEQWIDRVECIDRAAPRLGSVDQ